MLETQSLQERLQGLIKGTILTDEPLASHTYFRIGGPADVMAFPADLEDLKRLLKMARDEAIPVLIFGGGSNMLVPDWGVKGLVINLSRTFLELEAVDERIRCGAGVRTSRLLALSAMRGLTGLEGLTGIPGTVGGAIKGNAGTPLIAIIDHLDWIRIVDGGGGERILSRDALGAGYRRTALPAGSVIVEGCFTLRRATVTEIRGTISKLLVRRNLTQPVAVRSAGCIFKNPPGDVAGRLVERVGLKGLQRGGAQISEKHGNFIVNLGGATAADVLWLIERARTEVMVKTGVALELEIQVVGSPIAG
ncbi:UDP-N-acetylenolpyruvoylglucosamine reductase (MurB-like) [Candidatus Methylomirabilis lanthanidiphila]|uniref:UDP-N-acetylenolpyruvoylglucosamine reductase n=1 Tax=Candidatus Methylomirabilis lanthanidiphila TaxID=2211376 RepID=A0A564ZHL5_9BACT|nr:UDP-N-acetylmuramate dehydrogenase [Candidatus Methylomirabilis lanthanidiphila]VUZ84152.1 UDP-N-acetylenolpyruvoylglucosamine reductase (MurB-like) [Candidatus Methylomirabilis lanthanidiphila]